MNTGVVPCTDELSEDQLAWWRKSVLELLWRTRDSRLVLDRLRDGDWRTRCPMNPDPLTRTTRVIDTDDSRTSIFSVLSCRIFPNEASLEPRSQSSHVRSPTRQLTNMAAQIAAGKASSSEGPPAKKHKSEDESSSRGGDVLITAESQAQTNADGTRSYIHLPMATSSRAADAAPASAD